MSGLGEMLQKIDDNYLIGISNKGIVKRSYKDLEHVDIKLEDEGEAFQMQVDDCSCRLVLPLGDSKCSCPSRSICKHIVMAVIYAKQQYETLKEDGGDKDSVEDTAYGTGQETAESLVKDSADFAAAGRENVDSHIEDIGSFPEINAYPLERIKKELGTRIYRNVWEHIQMDPKPEIVVTSVITVQFPVSGITVKLLEPVEYSNCSCRKKELCRHKAQAILCYQLERGFLDTKQIEEFIRETEEQIYDREEIRKLADSMEELLGEIIFTGISRLSVDMNFSCERMAVRCHNLMLPEFEKRFRCLTEHLDLYFKRHAAFDLKRFMLEVSHTYQKTGRLKRAVQEGNVAALAGKARSGYALTESLALMGMGQRHFKSKTGYEGETIYFLEEHTGVWYTYTVVKPVFYDSVKKRDYMTGGAPWNLNCSLEELSEARILLNHGKVNEENRLSSTKDAVAELVGGRNISQKVVEQYIYDDFMALFEDKYGSWQRESEALETDKLAIIKPSIVEEAGFDEITQEFSMRLLDANGRQIIVQVSYNKDEKHTIRYLERLYRRIQDGLKQLPLFLGIVYLDEGKMKMYPIEDYGKYI